MPRSQKPSERKPAPIGQLAVLPLFHKLDDREVLAIGGTAAMAWKLELLIAAGARLVLAEGAMSEEAAEIAAREGLDTLTLDEALVRLSDFALVVADIADEALASRVFDTARAAGVPVNQIDRPEFCTVQFGSIVNRSPVVVGVSTDGAAPVLGQAIRARIETMLPRVLGGWADAAKGLRPEIAREIELPSLRRAWWRRFAERAMAARDLPETNSPALLGEETASGRVTLVGAGPGDPDLLTVKAIRALQDADVVLYDALVSDEVLEMARREARRMPVGKRGGRPSCKQEEINRLMIRFAREGRHVVRLKAGDPAIFSRGGEEVRALAALGIPVSIVPGITAASAAAANLRLTLTDRLKGRQLLFVSGHGRAGEDSAVDWRAIASGDSTVALYMGRGRIAAFARQAMAFGAAPDLPLSIGADISRPTESWRHATLATAAEAALATPPDAPCLILLGSVLEAAQTAEVRPRPASGEGDRSARFG
ncbi:MAG: siroheme synthase CysG [Minwuia sp.]|uniref:siroheme synthase CysG n=1 Tax=Minwuia sp. TaxID=2493630 RepID=UPI003A8C5DB7